MSHAILYLAQIWVLRSKTRTLMFRDSLVNLLQINLKLDDRHWSCLYELERSELRFHETVQLIAESPHLPNLNVFVSLQIETNYCKINITLLNCQAACHWPVHLDANVLSVLRARATLVRLLHQILYTINDAITLLPDWFEQPLSLLEHIFDLVVKQIIVCFTLHINAFLLILLLFSHVSLLVVNWHDSLGVGLFEMLIVVSIGVIL